MRLKPILIIFLFLVYISMVNAADQYKPYLHKATVPEHPKVKMYGTYTTNLFPGAATYSYPIEIPKGTNGLQPSISVYYNSQSVKQRAGIVGAGWGITESYIYRDTNYSLTDTSDDKFKLVLMGSSYDLAYDNVDGLYHTKTESYMRIRNYSGVDYWIITDRDGTQYRFGYNSDSEVTSNTGKGYSLFWYLDQITDTHNNNIYYTYQQNAYSGDKGAIYLSEIKYNNDLKRKISFTYAIRDDSREAFEQGNDVNYTGRLSEINVFANDALIRKYKIAYTKLNTASSLFSIGNITLYGNDNVTILNRASFDYYSSETGYNKNTTLWKPPVLFSNEYTVDFGVRLADLNNDGFVDFLQGRQSSSEKKIWLNNKNDSWVLSNSFALPIYFVDDSNRDLGVRFEDFNKDGYVDILQGTQRGSNILKAYRNNGTSFIDVSSTMAPPVYFTTTEGDEIGVQFADINGDGYIDIIQASNNGVVVKKVYLNNKSNGWVDVSSSWNIPTVFIDNYADTGARLVDFNADGLADIIEASNLGTSIQKAWLNNGSNWTEVSNTWKPLTYFTTSAKIDNGDRLADVNGDGLVDILEDYKNGTETSKNAWLNTGHGWSSSSSWQSPEPFTFDGNNIGRRIADANGDGFADVLVAYGNNSVDYQYTWVKNDTIPYLLKSITTEYGGTVNITYNSSTKFNNTGNDSLSDIGFNVYVVQNVENNNSLYGLLKVVSNTNYSYSGGRYDYAGSEFRGFSNVNETRSDNTKVSHYFYQDSILKGKEYRTEVYDSSNNPYTKEEKAYRAAVNLTYYKVFLDSVSTYSYEGNSLNPLVINVSYTYNDYGDVLRKDYHGDMNITGDEKWEDYVYYYNSTNWIMGKVRRYELEDNNTISKATWYSYDGTVNDGPQGKGDLTRVENWLSSGSNPVTAYEYDSYGNLIKETDALGKVTRHFYCNRDATCTYKDQDINDLGHITDYSYDLGTGNLNWVEKNDIKTYYYYDVFGRVLKEVQPYDSILLPTVSYNYSFEGVAPEMIKVSKKAAANDTVDSYYYYDGFSNLVQVRSSAENNQQTVKDLVYDGMFRVKSESHPYFMNFNLTLNVGDSKYTNYTYDTLGRVVLVKNADGTNKTVLFSKSNVTAYDENGHRHKYLLDSYGRISNVYEYNNDPLLNDNNEYIYNTSYYYDLQDNLIKITDTLGNNFIFGFDSLGRKISMDDPDLGKWSYGYDANNNLINQIDARNNYVNLSYDSLNRVLNKAAANGSINFSYDGQYFGTLSNVTYGNEVYRYTYDEKYRVVLEEVYLRSRWFNTGKTYDSMDRLIEQRVPNGTSIDYMYNAQGLIDKIPDYVSSTNYNAFGNPLNRTFASNNVMAFTYDADSARLSTIVTGTLQDLAYSYDNTGNIIQIYDSVNDRRQKMTYDFLDRLVNATINNSNYRYVYYETGSIVKIVNDYNVTTRFSHLSDHKHAPSSVVNGTAGVMVYKVKQLNTADKNRTVEFYLVNERNETLNNVNWTVDFGDGNLVNSSISVNLSVGQNLMIIVGHSYANAGDYNISVRASYANNTDSDDVEQIKFGVKAAALSLLKQNITNTTFEFKVRNDMAETANNINWSCDNGISSSNRFNLTGNETIFIYIASNYSTPGSKSLNCNATSSNGNDSKTLGFNLRGVEFVDYNSTIVSGNKRMVNLLFRNYFSTDNVNWTILSDGQLLSGTESVGTNNYSLVSHQINYTTQGLKTINSNITTTSTLDNRTETFVIKGLEIENYFRNNKTDTDTIFGYTVKNYWDNMSVNWSFTTPSINSQTKANLSYNETLFVFVEENYTSSGTKDINFTIFNGTMSTSFIDRLIVNIVEVVSNMMLYGSPDLSISEFVVQNHISPFNISWRFSTGTENITSNQNIVLNDTAFVIIASNYSSARVYTTEAYVNSSLYNDTLSGVVIA